MNADVMFSHKSYERETPIEFFEDLDAEYHFTLDVCATKENAKCKSFYTKEDDALTREWDGVCWMNPPYGRKIGEWVRKAHETALQGRGTVVCLLPARTDTAWWHDYCMQGEITFVRGRLRFGGSSNPVPFPSAVVVFKKAEQTESALCRASASGEIRSKLLPRRVGTTKSCLMDAPGHCANCNCRDCPPEGDNGCQQHLAREAYDELAHKSKHGAWEDFIAGRAGVRVTDVFGGERQKEFVARCDEAGVKWANGDDMGEKEHWMAVMLTNISLGRGKLFFTANGGKIFTRCEESGIKIVTAEELLGGESQ